MRLLFCFLTIHYWFLQEWLTIQLKRFISQVPVEGQRSHVDAVLDIPEIEPSTYNSLNMLLSDFKELSDTCLLVLHLEVRVHCFHYLMPVAKQV